MADNLTQSITCRYFRYGVCREGSNCRFLHERSSRNGTNTSEMEAASSTNPAPSIHCRFFKVGSCKFGNRCHYRHSSETSENSAVSSSDSVLSPDCISDTTLPVPKEASKTARVAEEWVNAPEFVPSSGLPVAGSSVSNSETFENPAMSSSVSKPLSYAQAVNPSGGQASNLASEPLCPYAEATGICSKHNCTYLHGEICELCGHAALHPYNEELRNSHLHDCVKQHEVDMEISFAIQRSKEKSCGICFEIIMEKSSREQRFGILPNCNHCFCLTCIRKWRQAKQFDNKIIRACPECRVTSDFVCPSMYWVDTKEEKDKLIEDYKLALSTKDCKHFDKGRHKCPFGNKCFYLHALPDGTKADVGPPIRHRRNADSNLDILQQLILWDFFEERNDRWMYVDLDDLTPFFSDSDDSDWSEYELSFD